MRTRLNRLFLAVSTCLISLSAASAVAQSTGPIKLMVGFAAGGSNDIVARIVAKKAGELLGVPVVVQNQPGANGAIAAEAVAKAAPDGKTLFIASPSVLAIAPHVTPSLPYNPLTDFEGIGSVAVNAQVIAVNPEVKAKTLQEFVEASKTSGYTMASAGNGGLSHLTIELLNLKAGGELVHVPYRGGALATNDAVAGHVNGIVMDLPPLKSFIESGRIRALAVTSQERSSFLPDVPTAIESGAGDMVAVNWFAILAPKGTPSELADKYHDVFSRAARDPEVVASLANSGIEPMTQASRAEFDAFLKGELEKWGNVVKTANVTVSK